MTRLILKWIGFLSLLIVLSCGSRSEPYVLENIRTVTKEKVIRDTIVQVAADSTRTIVQVDCPDGSPPKIKTVYKSKAGKVLKPPVITQNNNQLTIDCYTKAQQIALQLFDNYVSEFEKQNKPIYIEKPLKWYQKALMWIGGISLILISIGIILKIKK